MATAGAVAFVCISVALMAASVSGYYVTVDAHAEECFFDKVSSGTKMGMRYTVSLS